jgi:hypothetical protein
MKRLLLAAAAAALLAGPALAAQTGATAPINISTATTTQIVAAQGNYSVQVTHFNFIAASAENVTFEYGTGTNCANGTTAISGTYNLTSSALGIAAGSGAAAVMIVPPGQALCLVTSAAVQLGGFLSYAYN